MMCQLSPGQISGKVRRKPKAIQNWETAEFMFGHRGRETFEDGVNTGT